MDPEQIAVAGIAVAAISEIIALTPLKSNSICQLIMTMLKAAFLRK